MDLSLIQSRTGAYFSYKPRVLVDDEQSGLLVVSYTGHVICVCVTVLIAAYKQYLLWYVTPEVIAFALQLGMEMSIVLGSRGNVRQLFVLFFNRSDVI